MNVVLLCVWVHAWKLCENTDFKKNKGVVGPVQGWIGKHVCISHQQKITPAPHPGTMMQIALQWPHMQASVNKSVKTIHFSLTRAIAVSLFSFAICLAICKDILAQGGQSTWPEGQWDQCHNGIVFALWPCGCKSDHFSHPQHKWSISWPLCRACGGCVLHQCHAVEKAPNYSCNFKKDGRLLLPAMKTQLAAAQCHLQSMCQPGNKRALQQSKCWNPHHFQKWPG